VRGRKYYEDPGLFAKRAVDEFVLCLFAAEALPSSGHGFADEQGPVAVTDYLEWR
jgi:hypothetical protein